MSDTPIKIMYLNPVADDPVTDQIFADMARDHKLPGTEVHITALPREHYGFSHIEFRTYEALVTSGIMRAVRTAALLNAQTPSALKKIQEEIDLRVEEFRGDGSLVLPMPAILSSGLRPR